MYQLRHLRQCKSVKDGSDVAESDEEGKVEIKATNGICRAQLSFATKPSKLVIVVKKWSEALEGFTVGNKNLLEEGLSEVQIEEGVLTITIGEAGCAEIQDGDIVQFIDYYR